MTQSLSVSRIRIDGGTQVRFAFNAGVAADYAEKLREGETLPPITVFHDGTDYWAADGFHRIDAHRQAGFAEIICDVREGTKRDAFIYALGANDEHGLRRSNSDKQNAVRMALQDKDLATKPKNELAKICRVHHSVVEKVIKELEDTGELTRPQTTQDSRGRSMPTKVKRARVLDRPADREPGDESENEPQVSREVGPVAAYFEREKPRSNRNHFDDSEWGRLYGPLYRFVQSKAEAGGCVNSKWHLEVKEHLGRAEEAFNSWRKQLSA